MKVIFLWILLSVPTGHYNKGNVELLERFATKDDCTTTASLIRGSATFRYSTDYICVPASIAVPDPTSIK